MTALKMDVFASCRAVTADLLKQPLSQIQLLQLI